MSSDAGYLSRGTVIKNEFPQLCDVLNDEVFEPFYHTEILFCY